MTPRAHSETPFPFAALAMARPGLEFNGPPHAPGPAASGAPNSVERSEHHQHQRSPNNEDKFQTNVPRSRTILTRSHPRIEVEKFMAVAIDVGPHTPKNKSSDYAYYAQGRQTRGFQDRK